MRYAAIVGIRPVEHLLISMSNAKTFAKAAVRRAWNACLTYVWPALRRVLETAAALLFLFWEWGWRPLAALLARLARFKPWAMVEGWLATLPPYGALIAFALPTSLLLPLKVAALWLIAHGHALAAAMLFVAAKVVGTAFLARIFILTRPALMRLEWFARLYGWFMPWHDAMFEWIRASWTWRYGRILKHRAAQQTRSVWARLRPQVLAQWQALRPMRARFVARLRAIGQRAVDRLRALYSTNSSRP